MLVDSLRRLGGRRLSPLSKENISVVTLFSLATSLAQVGDTTTEVTLCSSGCLLSGLGEYVSIVG